MSKAGGYGLVIVALLAAPEMFADTVYMVDGLAISGKVKEISEKHVVLLLDDGVIGIPRPRVKRVDYDIESRKAQLAADDYKGHYELALLALGKGKKDVAMQELALAAGKKDIPADAWKTLAQLRKDAGDAKGALAAIIEYLKLVPDDNDAIVFRDEIGKTVTPAKPVEPSAVAPAAEAPAVGGLPAAVPADTGTKTAGITVTPAPQPVRADGLEDGQWQVEGWGNPATVQVTVSEGNKMLAILVPADGRQDKAAVSLGKRMDLTGKKKLVFSANVDGDKPVDMSVAFITDDFYESRIVRLKPGWNIDVAIDLTGQKDFKCRATNWAFQSPLNNMNRVDKIVFLVYNGRAAANIFIDDVRTE